MPNKRRLNFDDLVFKPISEGSHTQKATLQFSNNYGVNVYYRSEATNKWLPYEFEFLKNNIPTHYSEISDDNVGYCSKDDISNLLRIAQSIR